MKCRILLFALGMILNFQLKAQNDTIRFLHDLEIDSYKHKVSRLVFRSVFKDADTLPLPLPKLKRSDFEKYRGTPIRHITIAVSDPFGYDIADTLEHPINDFQRNSNSLHTRTKQKAIRNFLLFKEGDALDPYRISESIRLLRLSGLFRDALIVPFGEKDSVDLYIHILDRWSITGKYTGSSTYNALRIEDRNFLGLDHDVSGILESRSNFNKYGYQGSYEVNRISNTFINAKLVYNDDVFDTRRTAISIERPGISPLMKMSGGLTVGQYRIIDRWYEPDTIWSNKGIVYNGLDAWISKNILVSNRGKGGAPRLPMRNLVLSLRNENIRYVQRGQYRDSLRLYHDQSWVLGMIGISEIDYEQQQYISRYGEQEYVSVGKVASIVGGYDPWTESTYLGVRAGFAALNKRGYYSMILEDGQTFSSIIASANIFKSTGTWFSPLLYVGDWKIRQFVRGQLIYGGKIPVNQRLVFHDDGGIGDFKAGPQNGTSSSNIYLQTQAYAPWEFIGFRFGPVIYYSGTQVSNATGELFGSRYYSSFGAGFLMKNERLVINTFQVSISIFPYLPGITNAVRVNSLKAWDFSLSGLVQNMPDMVSY